MSVGPANRDAPQPTGRQIRSRGTTTDVRGSCPFDGPAGTLGSPQAELQDRVLSGRRADSRRLGRDQRLEGNDIEEKSLQKLRLKDEDPEP